MSMLRHGLISAVRHERLESLSNQYKTTRLLLIRIQTNIFQVTDVFRLTRLKKPIFSTKKKNLFPDMNAINYL